MKTIAQQLKVTTFPFVIKDKNGNEIYRENSAGYWSKCEYDAQGKEIYYENSYGYWSKREWDADGKDIRYENSEGVWTKREYYATNGKEIYYENSLGVIRDNRPKTVEVTLEEIAKKMGIKVEQLRIKD